MYIILEVIFILLLLVGVGTQVVVPLLQDRALFPLFREQGKLEKQRAEVAQLEVEKNLADEVDARLEALEPMPAVIKPNPERKRRQQKAAKQ